MAGEDTYDFGECTWYCAHDRWWVRGGWGNATDWAGNAARDGLQLTMVPTLGAVVDYAAGNGYSTFGHVAVVRQVYGSDSFLVSEMNYVAWDEVDERVSNLHDVEAFILPPGVQPGGGGPPPGGGGSGAVDAALLEWASLQQYLNSGIDSHLYWLRLLQQRADAT